MRIKGTFLRSAVARRVFFSLLLAAMLPLLAFGGLGYRSLQAHFDAENRRASLDHAKDLGMRVFDRLSSAHAALGALAEIGAWQSLAPPGPALRQMLLRVATVGPTYEAVSGDAELGSLWLRLKAPAGKQAPSLKWSTDVRGPSARVLISHPDPQGRGWWIAELTPAFVWSDFGPDGAGDGTCVTDTQGQALRCAGDALPPGGQVNWSLFLTAAFGSGDWRFAVPIRATPTLGLGRFDHWAVQAGAATVLLIAVLGLVLVRRTMVPLEQLTEATAELAAGRWSTRVALPSRDEFGQLARSLNAMAGRIGEQMQTLEAHSAIDRAILDGVDVDGVMQHVADRLRALMPGVQTAVLTREDGSAGWRVYRRGGAPQALQVHAALDVDPSDGAALQTSGEGATPGWVHETLGLPADGPLSCCWAQVPGQGGTVALLLMAAAPPWSPDAEACQAVLDLRDRVAVTMDAAARERRLLERALRDGLTGLLNRNGLHDEAQALLSQSDASRPCAMMFVDLDGFKQVNDAMGHHTGDELLRAVAGRLRQAVPGDALVARPGGDEFVVMMPGPAESAEHLAGVLCKALAERFQLGDQPVHVGASIGIAMFPADGDSLVDLMRRADLAMYAAKSGGRGVWRRFTTSLEDRVAERAWIARDLRDALDQGQLTVHYQPRVDALSGTLSSVEALVRWPHPQRGMVPPNRFIPVAEDSGLVERLGVFVLERAMTQLQQWRRSGVMVPRIAVNVSAKQLQDDSFTGTVLPQLVAHGLAPTDLELEITESLFVGDASQVSTLLAPLRAAGVSVAMDDFGTGYSSLAALHSLPFDVLKIDQSFVAALGSDRSVDAVVRSVMLLARELGKHVVAEGIETEVQRDRLVALGCDEFQGYLFARPLPAEALAVHPLAAAPAPALLA